VARRRPKVGDVLEFQLPDGTYAYGRVLRDACVAFYRRRSAEPAQPPLGERDYEFTVGVYEDVVVAHTVVGHDPSIGANDDWPPAQKVIDPISASVSIYERGVMRPSTAEEAHDLEAAAVWDERHLIERLVSRPD
jgi:hypothetical protein